MAGFWDFLNPSRTSGRAGEGTDGVEAVPPFEGEDVTYARFSPHVEYLSGGDWANWIQETWGDPRDMTPAEMWKTQPHLRTVVDFVARNIAQLGLHVFERVSETDRKRSRDNAFAEAIADPGDGLTTYDLIFALFGDKLLYDRAYWLPYMDDKGKRRIRRIPPAWVGTKKRNAFAIETYKVSMPGGTIDLPAERLIVFRGYSPTDPTKGSPTIEALKEVLAESVEGSKYRAQVWKKGNRASAVISRPAGVKWTDKQAERFREDWYANYTGDGERAGGTPILEDGMKLERIDFSAEQQQWAEGVKLSFATVASAFHVNPTMVGILEDANYSNVREFRKMLYGDTLGPHISSAEAVFNTFALPYFKMDTAVLYAEFNIGEKLQGSFEEQAEVLSKAIGAPYMTRNEGRGRMNLPAVEGGDDLVTPLNVLIGGQASPQDGQTGGRGGGEVPVEAAPAEATTSSGFTPAELAALINAAATLIRSGFDPKGSLVAVGLDPVDHLGLLPVTVQRPAAVENVDEEIEEALKMATLIRAKAGRRATKATASPRRSKSRADATVEEKVAQVVWAFFKRQEVAVRSKLGAKADDEWWDEERWDNELAHDLTALATLVTGQVAASTLKAIGFEPDVYDEEVTLAWLAEVSRRSATSLNAHTRDLIAKALEGEDPSEKLNGVFAAQESRAVAVAASTVTLLSGFASVEATKQAVGEEKATKTWVTGANARPDHQAMDGETVLLSEEFSNGAAWPGDGGALGAEDLANCNCELQINVP